ncbi:ABC transporter substrate-binding protein [Microbacterium immunditiarum]|nr:ABC transporter substrate-binding protein [Microbacterium immunditiarum]
MTVHRRVAAVVLALVVAVLAGCAPALPSTVVVGTRIAVGWNAELTSLNAAAAPTAGNLQIAQAIRADFGDIVDGDFVSDESFGTVAIVREEPFTVRYDLGEPSWSDGIPLDAADLLLGWAASAGYFASGADDVGDGEPEAAPVPTVDEFGRSIDVTFAHPTNTWQSAITVPVAAHIVGKRAFGLDDDMEAKQAVIRAVQEADAAALAAIADVWRNAFTIPEGGSRIAPDLLVSSGPFRLDQVDAADEGQTVTLVADPSYRGAATPQVAQIDLVPAGAEPVAAIGGSLDIVQVGPTASHAAPIKELERRDHTVQTTHDGTVWTVLLEPTGVFADAAARAAFLRMVPSSDLVDRGAGVWSSAYTATTSLLSAPGSRAYEVVSEDSGFAVALGKADDPVLEREAAGVAAGSTVCVLYERSTEFAAGAFAALRDAAQAAGWSVADCGSDDVGAALDQGGWNAAIVRIPIPQTPADVAAQWGSEGDASLLALADPERDALIAQLAQTVDVYEAREVLAQVEATLVRAAVARPFAANPRLTILDRDVTGVTARNGADASLTHSVAQWAVAP